MQYDNNAVMADKKGLSGYPSVDKRFDHLPDLNGEHRKMSDLAKMKDRLAKQIVDTAIGNPTGKERIIGDNHFFDPNIIAIERRPFKSVQSMNEHMIHEWNAVTDNEDTVIVNGDFIDFGHCTRDEGYEVIGRLKGHIVLILGNHDKPYKHLYQEYPGSIAVIDYPIVKDEFWIISHEPKYVSTASPYANVFAHVHTNPMYKNVSPRSFCTSAERLGYMPVTWDYVKEAVLNYDRKESSDEND